MNDYEKIYADSVLNEYSPKSTSKALALRKLDARAKLPSLVFTYTFGVIAAFVLGVGMCLSMKVIGDGSALMLAVGVILGIVGLGMVSVNYPIFRRIQESGKKKYAADILALAQEIKNN